ncbi:hypothetical protein HK102_009203, partial [Quaeritorhiza haematococci]
MREREEERANKPMMKTGGTSSGRKGAERLGVLEEMCLVDRLRILRHEAEGCIQYTESFLGRESEPPRRLQRPPRT